MSARVPSPYSRTLTPDQNAKRFKRQLTAWINDPVTIKRHANSDTLFAAIRVLVELGEMDVAYTLRCVHDTRLIG